MTTVSVFGNCQVCGIADSLKVMLPDHAVVTAYGREIRNGVLSVAKLLDRSDILLVQNSMEREILDQAAGRARNYTILTFPAICFSAFHPDCVHAGSATGNVNSP